MRYAVAVALALAVLGVGCLDEHAEQAPRTLWRPCTLGAAYETVECASGEESCVDHQAPACLGLPCARYQGGPGACTRACKEDYTCPLGWVCAQIGQEKVCAPPSGPPV
jgi:hypothetical protein